MKPRDLGIGAAIAALWALALTSPLADRFQGLGIDSLYQLRDATVAARHQPADSNVAIVAIDEESYQTPPFKGTPKVLWTQDIARVIQALLDAGITVIGFDIVFPTSVESRLRGFDRDMRKALWNGAKSNRIVLGMIQHRKKPILPHDGYRRAVGLGRNLTALNVITDPDGINRRIPLFFQRAGLKGGLLPSMSLEMASRHLNTRPAVSATGIVSLNGVNISARPDRGVRVPNSQVPVHNNVSVRYEKKLRGIPTYSMADLVACAKAGDTEFLKKNFAGKAVMLGTVLDVEDRKLTSIRFSARSQTDIHSPRCRLPVSETLHTEFARESIPGIFMQATAINNLIRGEVLRELKWPHQFAMTFMIAAITALLTLAFGPAVSAVLLILGTGVWISGATFIFTLDWVVPLIPPPAAAALTFASLLGYRFAVAERMGRRIRHAFGHYLAPAVVNQLVEEDRMPSQGGEMRHMTVWISDLEKYSTIAENFEPPRLVDLLNTVYTEMSDTIEEYRGFVAQFVGDAVVGAFGAPLDDEKHAENGVIAAMECVRRVNDLNDTVELPGDLKLRIRVGISSGDLLVGNIGSERRLSYAIVGDDINLSSRLEGANKVYGTQVLVNGETVKLCSDGLLFREIDIIRVVGRDTPVKIYEPIGFKNAVSAEKLAELEAFATALAQFRARNFQAALSGFQALSSRDPAALSYVARAQSFIEMPPPSDWDGILAMDSK